MIIQEFYWDETKILTIVHEKMVGSIEDRIISESISISEHTVSFKEYYSEMNFIENFEYNSKIEGFLACEDYKNPYNNYSTHYKEFINLDDNILVSNNEILIDRKDFKRLMDFIKEYSNFNLTPAAVGNLFLFSPIKIDVKSHNSEDFPFLTIEGSDANGIAFVKFKLDNVILESYVLNDVCEGYEIYSKGDWDNYEIEIFNDGLLIYKAKYSIIRSISLNINVPTQLIEKKFLRVDDKILITIGEIVNSCVISDNSYLDILNTYLTNEKKEYNKFIHPEESYCNFLKIDERERAFKIFKDIIKQNKEMWIFDPFFISDNSGVDVLLDILTSLASTPKKKHIIFTENPDENEQKNMTFEKYKNQMYSQGREILRDLNLENLIFIKANEKFHDRFLFLINEDKIVGYQIGTSLNSFGTNYSNIVKLNDLCAKEIFEVLHEDVITDEVYSLGD